jgi:hypothetical protein
MLVSAFTVGNQAILAAFYTVFQIHKVPAALVTKHIERAVAEKAIKFIAGAFMTWVVFAPCIAKKFVVFHKFIIPLHFNLTLSLKQAGLQKDAAAIPLPITSDIYRMTVSKFDSPPSPCFALCFSFSFLLANL